MQLCRLTVIGDKFLSSMIYTYMFNYKYSISGDIIQWSKVLTCPIVNNCLMEYSESLISSDQSTIYTLSTFGLTSLEQAVFIALNSTDGSLQGSRYYSGTTSCTEVYSLIQASSVLYSILKCTGSFYIVSISLSSVQFTMFKMINGAAPYSLAYEASNDRLSYVGFSSSSSCYFGKAPLLGLYLNPDIANSTNLSFSVFDDSVYIFTDESLSSTGQNNLPVDMSVAQTSVTSYTIYTMSSSLYKSAYSYILNSITIDPVSPGSTGTYTMNSSCSVSTTVSIPALTQLDGSDLPSWTVYNSSTDVMTWTAPTNNSLTQLLLQYCVTDTTYTSLTGCTSVTLKLIQSSTTSTSPSSSSNSTNTENSYKKSETNSFSAATYSAIALTSCVTAALSFTNISSMSVVWMFFGQMRIFQLLLLQSGFVSQYVIDYITGFKFTLFSFDFLRIRQILKEIFSFVQAFLDYFDKEQKNDKLKLIGVDSESTLVNNFNFYTTFVSVIILNLWHIYPNVNRIIPNIASHNASLSFSIAILQIVLCFLILIAIFILWIKLRKDSRSEKFQIPNMNRLNDSIEELYKDLNEKYTAKGFMLLSNLRVFSLSVCVMCIKKDQIYEIVCIQAIYLFLVVLIRPFDKVHLNIIAIQNEIFLLILSSLLIFLNTESKWKNSFGMLNSTFGKINGMTASESLYICLLTLNTFITMIIIIIITMSNIISRFICKRNMRISDEHIEASIGHPKASNIFCKCFRKSQKSSTKTAQSQISMIKLEETKSTPSLEQVRKALASVKRKRLYNVAQENSVNITLPSSKRLDFPS